MELKEKMNILSIPPLTLTLIRIGTITLIRNLLEININTHYYYSVSKIIVEIVYGWVFFYTRSIKHPWVPSFDEEQQNHCIVGCHRDEVLQVQLAGFD